MGYSLKSMIAATLAALAAIAFTAQAHCQPKPGTQQGNVYLPALITLSGAGAGTTNSADQPNAFGHGVIALANISAKSGTIDVTVGIQGYDPVSNSYFDLCRSASQTAAGAFRVTVYPGITAVANVTCSVAMTPTWRVQVISGAGTTPSVTMTVGAAIID